MKVHVDGKQVGVGISLKYGDVKQFGQVGGTKWESMKTLFGPLGVRFSKKLETDYIDMVSKKRLAPALTKVYTEASNQISRKLKDRKILIHHQIHKYNLYIILQCDKL